jgi:hypothetical protein
MGQRLNSVSLAILAFCAGMTVSFFTLPMWVVFVSNVAREGARADWIGFAGSIIGASMTVGAAIVAWFAVQAQINATRRHSEALRSDAAGRRLAAYAVALDDLTDSYFNARIHAGKPSSQDGAQSIEKFRHAADSSVLKEASIDGILGDDGTMLRFLVTIAKASVGDDRKQRDEFTAAVGPLSGMLSNSIQERQRMLRAGAEISDLHEFAYIDQRKFMDAYIYGRPPPYPK